MHFSQYKILFISVPYQVKSIQATPGLNWIDLIGSRLELTWYKTKPAWIDLICKSRELKFPFLVAYFLIGN
jgi:hypothetical protein